MERNVWPESMYVVRICRIKKNKNIKMDIRLDFHISWCVCMCGCVCMSLSVCVFICSHLLVCTFVYSHSHMLSYVLITTLSYTFCVFSRHRHRSRGFSPAAVVLAAVTPRNLLGRTVARETNGRRFASNRFPNRNCLR